MKLNDPLWSNPNVGATNSSGFSALPVGYRFTLGSFLQAGEVTVFWSSTEIDATFAWGRSLDYNNGELRRYITDEKIYGFSCRCLKD